MPSTRLAAGFPKPLKDYACVFRINVTEPARRLLGPAERLRPRRGRPGRRPGRSLPTARATTARWPRRLLPAALGEAMTPPGGTTFGQVADFTHPLFQPLRRRTRRRPLGRPGLSLLGGDQAARGPAPAGLRRRRPGAARADIPGAGGRPRPALDHPPVVPADALATRPPGTSSPLFWSFCLLMKQTVPYLAGTAGEQLNYEAGEDVILPIDPARRFTNYIVQGPDAKTTDRLTPRRRTTSLVIVAPQPLGQWTVAASDPDGRSRTLGFSVNPPADESQLSPCSPATSTPSSARTATSWPTTPRASSGDHHHPGRPRDLPLAHGPDPDPGDRREPPGQPVPSRRTGQRQGPGPAGSGHRGEWP